MTLGKKFLRLRCYDGDYHQTYLELADHPHELTSCVIRTVRIHNLIENYDGPGIAIDFDKDNRAVGIEILYPHLENEAELDE